VNAKKKKKENAQGPKTGMVAVLFGGRGIEVTFLQAWEPWALGGRDWPGEEKPFGGRKVEGNGKTRL